MSVIQRVVYTSRREKKGLPSPPREPSGMHGRHSAFSLTEQPLRLTARSADIPLYQQIRESLREQIRIGTLKPADQLPSEEELGRKFRVTRMTVRQAISDLAREGLVYRRHGKGTCVGDPKVTRQFATLTSF